MSTKLYYGYRLPDMSFRELQEFLVQLRTKIVARQTRLICESMAELATAWFDQRTLGVMRADVGPRLPNSAWDHAFHFMAGQRRRSREGLRTPFDFDFSVCLYPSDGCILAITFCEQARVLDVWRRTKGVKFFGYWNNTDRAVGVSESAWKARHDLWEKALGPDWVPAERGLTFEVSADGILLPAKKVLTYQPAFETRCSERARDLLFEEYQTVQTPTGSPVSWIMNASEWIKANPDKLTVAVARAKETLKPKITVEDVYKEWDA